jgi:hypothetical protein
MGNSFFEVKINIREEIKFPARALAMKLNGALANNGSKELYLEIFETGFGCPEAESRKHRLSAEPPESTNAAVFGNKTEAMIYF